MKSHAIRQKGIDQDGNFHFEYLANSKYGKPILVKQSIVGKTLKSKLFVLQNEYEITHNLTITGIRKSLDFIKDVENRNSLVLEYIPGETFYEYGVKSRRSLREILYIFIQVVEILREIHQQGIIHKNINSQNILVDPKTNAATLIDFGIATTLSLKNTYSGNPDELEGNVYFISPEQTNRMNRTIDYRTDIYSLGITLYEAIAGRVPFDFPDPLDVVYGHLAKSVEFPERIAVPLPDVLKKIILKMLAKNPEDRYSSEAGLEYDLNRCLNALDKKVSIPDFPIGERDFSGVLQIPEKLYGREKEISKLIDSFSRVCSGQRELLLVSGVSGVGKSSLVLEVQKFITTQKGNFISGKFDQLHFVPYAALTEAFTEFINSLLTKSPNLLTVWKERILNSVGSTGQVLIDAMPNLQLVIGAQPEVPKLHGEEARNRFKYVFKSFVKVIADKENPLVLFIDDLQWSDNESLELIHYLLTDSDKTYLLVIAAYRSNEVPPTHKAMLTINEILNDGVPVESIEIGNLRRSDINQLIIDSLNPISYSDSELLTTLLEEKTFGNAFFVKEYLYHLYNENLIRFEQNTVEKDVVLQWKWYPNELEQAGISENMINLIKSNISGLKDSSRKILKLASAIGHRFRISMLSVISEQNPEEIFYLLQSTLGKSIILPVGQSFTRFKSGVISAKLVEFKFVHDWVQQAVYDLIEDNEKVDFHDRIGNLLLKDYREGLSDTTIFDVVNQLNLGEPRVSESIQKTNLAELNLDAAMEAKKSAAFHQAFDYLRKAINLLDNRSWEENYSLTLQIFSEGADAAYQVGDFETMQQHIDTVLNNAKTILDCENAYLIQIHYYNASGMADQTIITGLKLLRELGIYIPANPGKLRLFAEFIHSKIILWRKSSKTLLELPLMSSPSLLFASRILSTIGSAAYMAVPELTGLIALKSVILNVKYGNMELSPYNFAGYGLVLCGVVNDIERGYSFGQLSKKLLEKLEKKSSFSKTLVVINGFITFWKEDIRNTLKPLMQGHVIGLETGDLEYATSSLGMRNYYSYFSATSLDVLIQEISDFLPLIRSLKQEISIQWHHILLQSLHNLAGKSTDPLYLKGEIYDEDKMLSVHKRVGNKSLLFTFYFNKAVLGYLFGDTTKALLYIEEAGIYLDALIASYFVPMFHFYKSLIYLRSANTTKKGKPDTLKYVKHSIKKLKNWSRHSPINFENKYILLEAAYYNKINQFEKSLSLFDQSIQSAHKNKFIQEKALAQELASKACFENKRNQLAKYYIIDAIKSYSEWGAYAKVKSLVQISSEFLNTEQLNSYNEVDLSSLAGIEDLSDSKLDLSTVLKASMTLSEEVDLKTLIEKIMEIVMKNTGSERAFFILNQEGKLTVMARLEQSKKSYKYETETPIEEVNDLAKSIVYYTARTGKTILLTNASKNEQFKQDAYIVSHQPKSILCAPIGKKEDVSAIIYLENNLSEGAYQPSRLKILSLLSGQAAISIENASLYKKLEANLDHQVELIKAYQRFMPHEFLQTLGYKSILDVSLGDQVEKEVTVLFSDIRSYTSMAEKMTPVENFQFLNALFKEIRPTIESNNGFVSNLYGDGMMALFLHNPEDAINASIEIQKALKAFNAKMIKEGMTETMVGIGINTGPLVLGILGDEFRMSPGVVSDTVNIASRMEGLTKIFGVSIVISKETLTRIQKIDRYKHRFMGNVRVIGKDEDVAVYQLYDGSVNTMDSPTIAYFNEGLNLYYRKEFVEAMHMFKNVLDKYPDDQASIRYLKNASELIVHGTPNNWTGSEIMDSK